MNLVALSGAGLVVAVVLKLLVTVLSWRMLRSVPVTPAPASALLVIAHPDDESMFFAPTLLSLLRTGTHIYILCLSNGNAGGLGKVREKELLAACSALGVPHANVWVVDHEGLQDGMQRHWKPDVVKDHVGQAVARFKPHVVITFDTGGVSGHLNHICTAEGVRAFMVSEPGQTGVQQYWSLVTGSLLRKYSSWLEVLLAWLTLKPGQALYISPRPLQGIRAMTQHKSQWVWFRWLFVTFSSYTVVNTLEPLAPAARGHIGSAAAS